MKLLRKQYGFMKVIESSIELERDYNEKESFSSYYYVANATFFLYMFFVIYGTSIPFQKSLQEMDEIQTSNIVNQIVYTTLFLTALYSLIPKWRFVISIIGIEKIFFIFILWCSVTLIWSDYPFISFKRLFQYITTYIVFLSIFSHLDSTIKTLKYFKILLAGYILISFISVFTIPGAVDNHGLWKGLAASKNHLGQMTLISVLFFVNFLYSVPLKQKLFFIILLPMTLILFIGSSSVTSSLTLIIIIGLLFSQFLDKQFASTGIGRTISSIVIIFTVAIVISLIFLAPRLLSDLVGEAGRDLTLTGRTDLWHDVFQLAKTHLILGCGFQGFWVLDSLQIQQLYEIYIWIPIQAHNGYLDILNETGLIGLLLFIGTVINYFINLRKVKSGYFWKYLLIAALVINFTESTLIRPNITSGVLYMFSYLALFKDLNKRSIDEFYTGDTE